MFAMLVGALLISGASLWGIEGLEQDYDTTQSSYESLRQVYGEVGTELGVARELLATSPGFRALAADHVQNAADRFEVFQTNAQHNRHRARDDAAAEAAILASLNIALVRLRAPGPGLTFGHSEIDRQEVLAAIDDAKGQTGYFATVLWKQIGEQADAAARKRRNTMVVVGLIGAFVVTGAVLLAVLQYRSVVAPLQRLTAGVRRLAAGEFQLRLDERGTLEFQTLAGEFNRMAGELDEFYHRLEEKVAQKSRELTRSERLASVGFLAAGVAHEINNPIGIIAGYAEYSLSQLKQQPPSAANADLAKSLQVICDEAFRCKDIVGQLLSLARPGEAGRKAVDLAKVARDVIASVGGLRDFRDRNVSVEIDGNDEDLTVNAAEAEMKQVVLNLLVNAFDAVAPGGRVRIGVARNDGFVELRVRDDGRGMTPETLDHVFEPFFTEKRGAQQPGTGLGLSISNAIVESHGGQMRASSEGLGQGSEFLVRLPAAGAAAPSASNLTAVHGSPT